MHDSLTKLRNMIRRSGYTVANRKEEGKLLLLNPDNQIRNVCVGCNSHIRISQLTEIVKVFFPLIICIHKPRRHTFEIFFKLFLPLLPGSVSLFFYIIHQFTFPTYISLSKTELPMVPSGMATPKFSATDAPITAKVSSFSSAPPLSIRFEYATKGTYSLVWSVPV